MLKRKGRLARLNAPAIIALFGCIAATVAPPPELNVSQWSDKDRKLSSEASSEVGQWRTSRFEPQRGMMDASCEAGVWKTVLMTSAQVGKTEILNNTVGFHIAHDPAPTLVLQPTLEMGEAWSKDRLATMLRDTPSLRGKVADVKSRTSGNTILHKVFHGGHLTIAGANSPASLASRPIRLLFIDEVDRFPISAGSEGDPVMLAIKRTNNFWNRKIILASTPTIKGISRIEREWEQSDKRRFHIACPSCAEEHTLQWANVVWDNADPATARFKCPHCTHEYNTSAKNRAVSKGRWIATAPFNGVAGFHINELYSPWRTLQQIVTDFLVAKDDPEMLKTFVNTVLGETWEEGGLSIDEHDLAKRCENYAAEVPGRVLLLSSGIDVHPDRLEAEVVGWAGGEESWSIHTHVIYGDPDIPEGQPGSPWDDLTSYRRKAWKHELYGEMSVEWSCIDTGGQNTQAVYEYVRRHRGDRIFGIKGGAGSGLPIIGTPQQTRTGRKARLPIKLYTVGTDQAKSIVYRRLKIDSPGAGYCHFPAGRSLEWFKQLTSEKIVTKYRKGYAHRTFEKPSGARNEALDCRVYAFAALTLAAPQFDRIAYRLKQRAKPIVLRPVAPKLAVLAEEPDAAEEKNPAEEKMEEMPERKRKPSARRRRGGYVNSW